MAANSKRPVRYDLKKQDRRRNLLIQLGLTAIVVIFAVGVVLLVVKPWESKPSAEEGRAIRVTSSKLITKEGTSEPKAVLSLYEDFLCPACGNFEQTHGPTISKLIDTGAVAAEYRMVSILDPQGKGYSSRSGAAAYCVADESIDAFRRFHAALYTPGIQPQEGSGVYPDNARLIEIARQAGAAGGVPDCINKDKYVDMVQGMAGAADIHSTPTIRINGQDFEYDPKNPQALVDKVKSIVGNVPGLDAPVPAPGQAPAR